MASALRIDLSDVYSSLANYSADGLVISDPRGVVTCCNPSFARLLDRRPEEIIGHRLEAIIDCSCLHQVATADGISEGPPALSLASAESTGLHNAVVVARNGMDITVPVSHIAVQANGSQPSGYLTVVYIVQASSVQQAQTEFVSMVSHELRTPLTSIKGFADTILRAGDRLDLSQQRRYVGIIKDQADRLTRLVEDLLAVSRLESRRLQLTIRAIDLLEAVQRVVRNLADKARDHKIVTKIGPGLPPVWADADRLEQILTNLVDNAIKYSPAGTTVTIAARDLDSHPEMVEFSVTDQGAGIPHEHQPEIFNKFSRLDNPLVRQAEGTGLGLYITRSLVLALGGQIKVASRPGQTTFTVQLPAATLEEQAARGKG